MTPERDPPIPLPAPAPADGARILHADDNAANRYVVRRSLRVAGFEVDEVATGSAALEAVASANPDLLILDVRLPDISGFEVCRRLKADAVTSRIPVVHKTAVFRDDLHRRRGLDAGADEYLTEPIEPQLLVDTVKRLLARRGN
jgi:CheY-like chemotaxis protein